MYLKSLALRGFKSFVDRTTMSFDPGLSVVVGPNGSGKSNIADAILWVLGEQSAKQLRGDAMEDVIFIGSSARQPAGLAEVTLVLDNSDRTLPIEFEEVGITRRMYRSGESEYLINNAPARLRDIQDILHDTGLGKDTHSIISQGNLESVFSSRPEERRVLIEEAAEISKHRRRKVRSERKLATMNQNLLRAKDISHEVHRQLRPLARQVERAREAGEMRQRLEELTVSIAVDDLRRLQDAHRQLLKRGAEAEAEAELARIQRASRAEELERLQYALEQKGLYVGDLGAQRRRSQAIVSRIEADARLLDEKARNMRTRLQGIESRRSASERDRADAASELERIALESAEAKGRVSRLELRISELEPVAEAARGERAEVERVYARMSTELREVLRVADAETLTYARLRDEVSNAEVEDSMLRNRAAQLEEGMAITRNAIEQWRERQEGISARLDEADARVAELADACRDHEQEQELLREQLDSAREELSRARASLSAMKAVDEAAEAASPLVAKLAHDGDGSKLVECRLGDLVEAPPELEGVVERILGSDLSALVVSDVQGAHDLSGMALGMLSLGGTATIVPLSGFDVPRASAADDSLLDRLTIDPCAEGLFAALLGDVHVCDTLEAALASRKAGSLGTYACLDGAMVLSDGRIHVGTEATDSSGSLERKRRIRSLERGMSALEADLGSKTASLAQARDAFERANAGLQSARSEAARLAGEHESAVSELARLSEQLTRSQAEHAEVERTRMEATVRLEEVRPGLEEHRQAAEAANRRASELTRDMDALGDRRKNANEAEAEAQSDLSEARLSLATAQERMRYLDARSPLLEQRIAAGISAISGLEEESRSVSAMLERVAPLKEMLSDLRSSAVDVSERLAERADLEQADSETLRTTIDEARARLDAASNALEAAREESNAVKVELGRLEVQVETSIQAIADGGSLPLEEALGLPEPEDRAADEKEIERLNRALVQIGPVNEVALEQYTQMKERADYIDSQVGDLESASRSLARISAAIDRKMRDAFVSTFDSVNANFEDIFSVLFPGGHAHLELTDPANPTESGVEIVAQPRGKKLSKISLLSGGEKALTALALLFAVYRTRTVPFYVFDEVEAALDDSNLDRLLNAVSTLREKTQLIVISHQRRTMEMADVLWGVSMHADGVSHVVSQRLDHSTGKVVDA